MREWYGLDDPDLEGDERDVFEITTRSASGDQEPVYAIVDFVTNGGIGLHLHEDADDPQTLNVPNWASSGHAISVAFSDYPVD